MDVILFIVTGFLLVAVGYIFGKRNKADNKTEVHEDETDRERMAEKILW